MPLNKIVKLLIGGALVGIPAGIIASFLGGIFAGLQATAWGFLVVFVPIAAIIYLANKTKIDSYNVVQFAVFFASISVVGSIVTMLFPAAIGYILTVSEAWTTSGLLYTVMYAMLGERVMKYLPFKI